MVSRFFCLGSPRDPTDLVPPPHLPPSSPPHPRPRPHPLSLPTSISLPLPAADIITTVEFDYGGDHLATGDRGGRVVLFERMAARRKICGPDERQTQHKVGRGGTLMTCNHALPLAVFFLVFACFSLI
jgi:hypothetical protein